MRIRFTRSARTQLQAIQAYIARDQPRRANEMIRRILDRCAVAGQFPRGGRRVREYDSDTVREVIEPPYRIIYRVGDGVIDVLAVMHSRRLLPHDLT